MPRDYVERTGELIEKFRFDVQVGKVPTDRNKAKIFPEEHHYNEMINRLSFENECYTADLRGNERPEDPLEHNRKVKAGNTKKSNLSLFSDVED